MTLQQDLGGGPLFPEMEFCLRNYFVSACFTGLWKLTYWMVKFSSSGDICIWRYMQTTLSLIGENIQQLYLK